jgi:hypothetical protein
VLWFAVNDALKPQRNDQAPTHRCRETRGSYYACIPLRQPNEALKYDQPRQDGRYGYRKVAAFLRQAG